jgi:DNA polymerase-1
MPSSEDSMDDTERLFLADAMALAYRAHYAFINRPLYNSKGMNTSAVFGFTRYLLKLLEDENPEHIAVVCDSDEGPTFRDELYEEYKANRPPMPDDLKVALPYIKDIVRALDIPLLEVPGVEADDVIGTLARRAETEGVDTIIVSPDKDFRQLLSAHISILRPAYRGEEFEVMTDETFREKYELEPHQFVDILALTGDKSDNVPGVTGIGKKTAPKLLKKYGSVEKLVECAEEVEGTRARKGLLEDKQEALLSKKLVEIHTDVDLDIDWHRLRRSQPHIGAARVLFEELEFESMMDRVENQVEEVAHLNGNSRPDRDVPPEEIFEDLESMSYTPAATIDSAGAEYMQAESLADVETLVELLEAQPSITFDTETDSLEAMDARLVGCSFAWEEKKGWYVPAVLEDRSISEVTDRLKPVLEDESTEKIAQNLKYDYKVLCRHGLSVEGRIFDTMVAHYLLHPEGKHDLSTMASDLLNYRMQEIEELIGSGQEQKTMDEVPADVVARYACEDADITRQVAEKLREELEEEGLLQLAEEIEFPLVRVLADMELAGVKVNTDILDDISAELADEMRALEERIFDLSGEDFNINSPQQLSTILFEKLDMEVIETTSTGNPSTKESVLLELATEHELPGLVLDWRKLAKLKNTYVDALGDLVRSDSGRIHTDFNQTVAATGRLSSSNPNLQNIPIRTDRGRAIRRAFVADKDHRLISADYAQIELRIIASMSGDESMQETFRKNEDIHTDAAARVFGVAREEVTRDMRDKVKQVNYGIPYGISPYGLSRRLRVPVSESEELIEQYHESFPAVKQFLDDLVERARAREYVETQFGRRRYVPDINASNYQRRSAAERIAVNMPIQGTQADMIKLAMVNIHERIAAENLRSRMILQVHDELLFEVPTGEVDPMKVLIEEEMVNAHPLEIPIEVEIGVGSNWLEAH